MAAARALVSVDFEVFGKVQGVFFRKYTQQQAQQLGLTGWVKNTEKNTVIGTIQGPADQIQLMRLWLSTKGSPKSRIENCEFQESRTIANSEYSDFVIDRPKSKPLTKRLQKRR